MCSTEEDSALLHRSGKAGLVERVGEVGSVVREEGGENVDDGKDECGEAGGAEIGNPAGHGFREKDSSRGGGTCSDDSESCAETGT